jgi:thiosulfate dehydrogenase
MITLPVESKENKMHKSNLVSLFLAVLGVLALVACSPATPAATDVTQEPTTEIMAEATTPPTEVPQEPTAETVAENPAEVTPLPTLSTEYIGGGMLYDDWIKALGVDVPEGDQALWKTQTTNTRTGKDTYRCKECHGWDYKGVDGAYGSGSHQTGFKGVMAATSMSEVDLLAWLNGTKNADHDFSVFLQDVELKMLVDFLKEGVSDTPSQYINTDKTIIGADAEHGKALFNGLCQVCHAEDGKMLNFGDESEPEYVGTIAKDNPWEFWHKITFGQPGTQMPSALNNGWSPQDIADVLAYAQTLPSE